MNIWNTFEIFTDWVLANHNNWINNCLQHKYMHGLLRFTVSTFKLPVMFLLKYNMNVLLKFTVNMKNINQHIFMKRQALLVHVEIIMFWPILEVRDLQIKYRKYG